MTSEATLLLMWLKGVPPDAGAASMLHSASGGTGEHLLLASLLLISAPFLAGCIADMHDWPCRAAAEWCWDSQHAAQCILGHR